MKVLVFGAAGQIGEELVRHARAGGHEVTGLTRADHDVADAEATRARIQDAGPDAVYNAAAYTAVDRAESEPEMATAVNRGAPAVMAAACAEVGARFVHFSTDYVFDGSATVPIPEDANPAPLGVYGRSKLEGEEAIRVAGGDAYIVRTSWVYGLHGGNFVRTVLRVTRETGAMRVVDDQRGSPSWARDVAAASMRLIEVGPPGTYHLTNGGECSWYDLARATVAHAQVAAELTPIGTADYPTPAARPRYSVLDNRRWRELGQRPLRGWQEALDEFLDELAGVAT